MDWIGGIPFVSRFFVVPSGLSVYGIFVALFLTPGPDLQQALLGDPVPVTLAELLDDGSKLGGDLLACLAELSGQPEVVVRQPALGMPPHRHEQAQVKPGLGVG